MIPALLQLPAAAIGRTALRLALILSAAWCSHRDIARGAELLSASDEEILCGHRSTVAGVAAENDPSLADLLTVGDDSVLVGDLPAADRIKPSLVTPACFTSPNFITTTVANAKWIPQGMIPYIGPRTPDYDKDRGLGGPLPDRGWRTRPFSISGFSGVTAGNALIPGHVNQEASYYGGLNFGWDYDHYWGIEKRLGFGALNLTNGHHDPIGGTNVSVTGEYRLMYYPLGDARWRPFVTTGLGWSDFYFQDDHGSTHLDTVGMVPFGLGLKYLHQENLAVRVDLIDELTFAAGSLSTFHYVAFTAGLEVRCGHKLKLLKMPWQKKSEPDEE